MIVYSKHESDIFGVEFGRLNLKKGFNNWHSLRKEIEDNNFDFIRVRIPDPTAEDMDNLDELCKKRHLLEVLKLYERPCRDVDLENIHQEYRYETVTKNTIRLFKEIFEDTYEDIPFGCYTSKEILDKFPVQKQIDNISDFFYNNYDGSTPNKESYLIYNSDNQPLGCVTMEFLEDSYTYYAGIKKEFRKNYAFMKTINFIHHKTKEKGTGYSRGSARLLNLYSQKAFEKAKMYCIGYDWIYLLEL